MLVHVKSLVASPLLSCSPVSAPQGEQAEGLASASLLVPCVLVAAPLAPSLSLPAWAGCG